MRSYNSSNYHHNFCGVSIGRSTIFCNQGFNSSFHPPREQSHVALNSHPILPSMQVPWLPLPACLPPQSSIERHWGPLTRPISSRGHVGSQPPPRGRRKGRDCSFRGKHGLSLQPLLSLALSLSTPYSQLLSGSVLLSSGAGLQAGYKDAPGCGVLPAAAPLPRHAAGHRQAVLRHRPRPPPPPAR